MADNSKKRTFRKFTYRGIDLEGLIDLDLEAVSCVMDGVLTSVSFCMPKLDDIAQLFSA
jgi:hypothetical protein